MTKPHSAVAHPFRHYPEAGTTIEVAPGVHWLSTPLPFRLRAINLYLLEDGDGWTIVDCGYSRDDVRAQWEQVWATTLGGRPIKRLLVTHFHPDHLGNSAWICERWNLRPWLTQAEWLTANLVIDHRNAGDIDRRIAFHAEHGLDAAREEVFRTGNVHYSRGVRLPPTYNRLFDGDELEIGGRRWSLIVGRGHSPEHASFYCDDLGVLIAGDQLLPEITTNVSVWPDEPDADPLALFLQSLDRFLPRLRPDTLVLPAHRRPFIGAHARIAELKAHHAERLDQVLAAAANGPLSAGSLLDVLFPADLDGHQIGFAMGEALAHLNYLVNTGDLRRYRADGRIRFERRA